MNNRDLPKHFIIVGAQRSGTTRLVQYLLDHHKIEFAQPLIPEPKFFLRPDYLNLGYDGYRDLCFPGQHQRSLLLGEKSTSYYELESIPRRISAILPSAKILFMLRNPVDRAISNYKFSFQNGLEKRSLEEAFLKDCSPPKAPDSLSVNPFNYLGRGQYLKFIKRYREEFPEENIKVAFFENLIADPKRTLEDITNFLGVEALVNLKHGTVNASIVKMNVPLEVKREMTNHFRAPNLALSEFLGRKLPENWLEDI